MNTGMRIIMKKIKRQILDYLNQNLRTSLMMLTIIYL